MFDKTTLVTLDGVVRALVEGERGIPFCGAMIECDDRTRWVIDYKEQTPFHVFANRRVLASGQPYTPDPSYSIVMSVYGEPVGHFEVARLRVAEPTGDLQFAEVGPEQRLSGQFTRTTWPESMLSFTTETGDRFLVANDPAGAALGRSVKVVAYPLLPSTQGAAAKHLWIICPHSTADLWEWRRRHSS